MPMTVASLEAKRQAGEKLTMVTAYDASFARLLDASSIDIILVGDSLGHVIQGQASTLPVSLDEMCYHCRCVSRVCSRIFLVGDLPFGSYQVSDELGMQAAIRLMKEGLVQAVKLEGGARCVPLVRRLVEAGIPVCGHLGLTPQSVHQMSGYRVQGKAEAAAQHIYEDARALSAAGAFAIVLEGIPRALAKRITEELGILTIGIGAGPDCSGQVLVMHDLLGLNLGGHRPKFVREFGALGLAAQAAFEAYAAAVRQGEFPNDAESYH